MITTLSISGPSDDSCTTCVLGGCRRASFCSPQVSPGGCESGPFCKDRRTFATIRSSKASWASVNRTSLTAFASSSVGGGAALVGGLAGGLEGGLVGGLDGGVDGALEGGLFALSGGARAGLSSFLFSSPFSPCSSFAPPSPPPT